MAAGDLILGPESLEALLGGIAGLGPALGPVAEPELAVVRSFIEQAIALRRNGDRDAAVAAIATAMQKLAELAAHMDPEEGRMMRAIAAQFDGALRRGDAGRAAENVDLMRQKSGAVPRKPGL